MDLPVPNAPHAFPGRLATLARAWLAYVEKGPFRGGCFFAAVSWFIALAHITGPAHDTKLDAAAPPG